MGELVPDTPRGTAEPHAHPPGDAPPATQFLDSHGQSYLLDNLAGDSSRRTSSQLPATLPDRPDLSAGRPHIERNDDDDDVDQLDEDSVPDSQQQQQRLPPDDEANTLQDSLPLATPAGGPPPLPLLRSQSALVLGPDDPSGYSDHEPGVGDLGETQAAHSLDDDDSWASRGDKSRRRSVGGRGSGRASVSVSGRELDDELDGEDDVSMDLTRANGRVLPSHEDSGGHEAPRASDSQKENPSPSLPSARSQGYPPFSLSVQSNVDDASGAPSSSPAVALHLLASRRPATRKASPGTGGLDKPQASADKAGGAPSSSSGRRALSSSSNAWDPSTSMSGPETSTPAFANVPPAPPVTATRTLPTLTLADPDPLDPPLARSSTLPLAPPRRAPTAAAVVNSDLLASSAAMKAVVPGKKKRRAEAWDGISQSDESVRASESLATSAPDHDVDANAESATLPPTLVHDAGEPGAGASGTGREAREEKEGEPVEDETPLDATIRHDEGAGDESVGSSLPATAAATGPVAEDEADESSLEPLPRRNPNLPPLFYDGPTATASSSGSSPGSRSPVKADAATASKGKNRLSDISELKSSLEPPSQAIEVPATQTQYDVLQPASATTQDVEVDKSWHASFQHDTSTDSAATHRQSAPAPLTRALKRVAPPPTPVADHAAASSSASTSRPRSRLPSLHDDGADLSTLPQATQHLPVPESSPEVPLQQAASARARSPASRRTPYAGPSSRGVVVPDSDGPTQEEQQFVAESVRAVAAAKGKASRDAGRAAAPARAHAAAMDVDEPILEQDFGGGFDGGEEDEEMRDEGTLLEEAREEEEQPAPVSATKGKGKAKAKAKPKPKPVERAVVEAPEPVKKVKKVVAPPPFKGKSKDKGKGKASSRASTSSRRRARDDDDDDNDEASDAQQESDDALDLFHETNYSAPPALKNSKARSARASARAPVVKKDKGKRRASATPPPPLDEDEDDAPSPRKKRKVAATPVVEIPVSSPVRKPSSSRATSATKKRVVAPSSAVVKKGGRRSSASAASTRAASPEPPAAGPSRSRLRSASRSEPARTPSPALTTDSKPSIKSRLLPSAPFTRVLAFWRDGDTGYYPGTIVALVGGKFDVLFDDGSRGKILPDEIRRCELVADDRCTSWDHEPDTETQRGSFDRELVVTAVEREAPADEDDEAAAKPGQGLSADDVLVVRAGTRSLRIPVSAIRISPRNALQLDDRRLTDDELALFEGKERPRRTTLQRLDLLKAPKAPAVDEMRKVTGAERDRLFGRTAFIVTTSTAGSIAVGSASSSSSSAAAAAAATRKQLAAPLEFRKADFRHVEDIFLLTNRACQTSKYLVSLALGVPCLSLEFAVHSTAAGVLLDWRPYLLTAGYLHDLGTYGLGSQLRALSKTEYGLESLAAVHAKGGVFKGKSFVVVMRKGDRAKADTLSERSYAVLSLLACASARLVHFVATVDDARAATGYDYVFLEDDSAVVGAGGNGGGKGGSSSASAAAASSASALRHHKGLVNMVWLKQCLMAGRLLPAERMRQVDE
ncbi:uncharacterized protein RHOBADRAFT_52852 [Rhodotorula graminis WP1]|uniref:DNA repair protein Crb2 Tudor domain-containing protein n=1 Tax=Rhodotorula graminis (strain WP1) TaxID=578459 RepID=A0A194S5P8_RHOGW|nr:uncharacterized protein RHOBADRAFT_52852 [Rhodotorula graminis WP1]KPV75830.1 hypothetical protein RHOBADRAFT_52852 [Rhodotorula graminis WP1]